MRLLPKTLIAVVLGAGTTGCLHYSNLHSCHPSGPEATECFESSHADETRSVHRIREEIAQSGSCDRVELEQVEHDATGRLRGRSREQRVCGALVVRRTETYDANGALTGAEVEAFDRDDDELPTYRRRWGDQPRLTHARARRIATRP